MCGSPKLPSHFLGEDRRDYARAGALCFSSCTSFVVSHRRKEAEAKRVKEGAGQQHEGEKDITEGRNFRGTRRDGYIGARKREEKRRRNFEAKRQDGKRWWSGDEKRSENTRHERGLRKGDKCGRENTVTLREAKETFPSSVTKDGKEGGEEKRDTQGMKSRKANLTFISGILGFAL